MIYMMTSQQNEALIPKLRGSFMFLSCFFLWMFVQPGTDTRPVNWCRN